jgi:hypothetical protein
MHALAAEPAMFRNLRDGHQPRDLLVSLVCQ